MRSRSNRPGMASPATTWSITACLSYRRSLDTGAAGAAKNVLPARGWGHCGERLSFLRRLRLDVTCRAPAPDEPDKSKEPRDKKPRILRLLRSLRSRLPSIWRRKKPPAAAAAVAAKPGSRTRAIASLVKNRALPLPVPSVWRRKKQPSPPCAAVVAKPGSRTQATHYLMSRALLLEAPMKKALCFVAALAIAAASEAALRLMVGFMLPSCESWRCFLANSKKFVEFLGPPLFESLCKISLILGSSYSVGVAQAPKV